MKAPIGKGKPQNDSLFSPVNSLKDRNIVIGPFLKIFLKTD
jgi:hypothetical protein